MAHLNLKQEAIADKIPALRAKVAEKAAGGEYNPKDVDRINTDDIYAGCFLRTLKSRGDVDKAMEVVDACFKFRKEQNMIDLKAEDFPEEIKEKNAIYYKGKDVNGDPILYIDVGKNTATGDQVPILKRYIAYNFEMYHREHPEQMCVVLLDMSNASTGNMNLDVTKFIITCFTTYFPSYLSYMINFNMPFLISATWKIISAFLSSEQKQKLLMVKKKDITKHIPEEHLWDHMK